MRYAPTASDQEEVAELNAEPWMLDLLKLNHTYNGWGNFEDYMWKDGQGWDSRLEFASFGEMFKLDDLNECVNFYFEISRRSEDCTHCDGSGYNHETRSLSDAWYSHMRTDGLPGWSKLLAQAEVEALWDAGRLFGYKTKPTPEQVNLDYAKGMGHDAINQYICVEARAKHLGVWGKCEHCGGSGTHYLQPTAHVALQLWILHPRKGCSRGVYIKNIGESDLPKVYAFLREAAARNADRFSRIPANVTA